MHSPAVGHVTATLLEDASVKSTNLYEAFGRIVKPDGASWTITDGPTSGASDNNCLANTKERDRSIGLDNHGMRYYDPEIGRYTTRDPIGYRDGLNVYRSVFNNPINYCDPLGLGLWDWIKTCVLNVEDIKTAGAYAESGGAGAWVVGRGAQVVYVVDAAGNVVAVGAVAKGIVKGGLKLGGKLLGKIFGKAAKEVAGEAIEAGLKQAGKATAKKVAAETSEAATKQIAKEAAGETGEAAAKQVAKETAGETAEAAAKEVAPEASKARLPAKGTAERKAIEEARKAGVRGAQAGELDNIRKGGQGSGAWTEAELRQIRETGEFPKDVRWHHDPTVANRPDLAGNPDVVKPVRGGTPGHLEAHSGDWRLPKKD